ncbi:hypothetical protein [Hymenobacter terrestris]|uniref:DUF2116 family Zn-ribbon domain-containing protein n=1 Tax=Hymenobacter terrestris TaxID=2748310 RepID=A0ABX2Q708_9BACT|nr:hypothetical protein [Hymenobacter terrestris]NVO86764.1 hypothetical protein [Hymenobacter terrestris]
MRIRRARRPKDQLPNSHLLACQHCHQEYVPVKRGTQKFCSSSCRSTHSKQKKAGTLGKFTSLPGPTRGGLGFLESTAAAGVGAATANALEYLLVTRHLVSRSEEHTQQLSAVTELLQHVLQQNAQLQQQLLQLSQALGVPLPPRETTSCPPALAPASLAFTPPVAEPLSEAALTPEQQAIYAQMVAAFSEPEPVAHPTPRRAPTSTIPTKPS